MIDNKTKAQMDQNSAFVLEYMPPLWWGLYKSLMEKGFSEQQSLELVKAYIART